MTRFSVKRAEPETAELQEVIPTLDSDVAKSQATADSDITEDKTSDHDLESLFVPKSAMHDSSITKNEDYSPKEVRFDMEERPKPEADRKFFFHTHTQSLIH